MAYAASILAVILIFSVTVLQAPLTSKFSEAETLFVTLT
jgi:hypothetical protein